MSVGYWAAATAFLAETRQISRAGYAGISAQAPPENRPKRPHFGYFESGEDRYSSPINLTEPALAIFITEIVLLGAIKITEFWQQAAISLGIPALITLSVVLGTMWRSKNDQKAIMDALTDPPREGETKRTNKLDRLGNILNEHTAILTEIRDLLRQNRGQNTS